MAKCKNNLHMFKFAEIKGLMTTDNLSGVWTYSLNLARELKKHDISITLAIMGEDLTDHQKEELKGIPYFFAPFRQEWMKDPWEDIEKAGEWLMHLKERINPDFIHLNTYSLGRLKWKIPVIMTLHSCLLTWWDAVKKEQIPREWYRYKANVEDGIRSADVVIAPSKSILKAAEKFYGRFLNRKIIYNGGDMNWFRSDTKEKYIFSMGRIMDEAKNIDLIIKAAPCIKYNIYIAGDNNGFPTENLPRNIIFLGKLSPEQKRDWLSHASLYLLPVKYEPFGYTFLEAAFSGCALITGEIDSMKEIWDDAAVYIDNTNSSILAEQVNTLMYDDEYRNTMAEKARKRAESRYTVEKMAVGYLNLYREIKVEYEVSKGGN